MQAERYRSFIFCIRCFQLPAKAEDNIKGNDATNIFEPAEEEKT